MAAPGTDEITGLLRAWSAGDEQALLQLTPVVYDELRRRSHRYMAREPAGHILQTTALVNEVYLRLVDLPQLTWQDRTHFFAVCARLIARSSPTSRAPAGIRSAALERFTSRWKKPCRPRKSRGWICWRSMKR
jgi:ECF sigma factor